MPSSDVPQKKKSQKSVPWYIYCIVPWYVYSTVPWYIYCIVPWYVYSTVPWYIYSTAYNVCLNMDFLWTFGYVSTVCA